MAQRGAQQDSLQFSYSICGDLLKDPVTAPCAHSYCSDCIKSHWDEEEDKGIYSCPQGREEFLQRPALEKNSVLAELVEDLKKRSEKQEELEELEASRLSIQQRIQERQEGMQLLQQQMEAINVSADEAAENIRLVQETSCEVKQQLRTRQQTAVSGVKELQEKLEQEIAELQRKEVQLGNTEDHGQFLRSFPSELKHSPSIPTAPLRYFQDVAAAAAASREKLQDVLRETNMEEEPQAEPETRAQFLRYSQQITLDPNTAHRELLLSDGDRKVTYTEEVQRYSEHPDRFAGYLQVLSRESLTGRRYWEVECKGGVYVAVAYKSISRAGSPRECVFAYNDKSWALDCGSLKFWHDYKNTVVSGPRSSRVGVYLDHRAGILSFYSVSEAMTLLHRVQTSFTQPLHAGVTFYFDKGASAEFLKPQ